MKHEMTHTHTQKHATVPTLIERELSYTSASKCTPRLYQIIKLSRANRLRQDYTHADLFIYMLI